MTAKEPKERFVKLLHDLLESDPWRSLSINARRLIDFLMLEHMAHAGQRNGYLVAPRRQLEQAGIGARYVSAAIEEVERMGIVDVRRGVGRRPSVYALTWLPMADGAAPSHRWRAVAAAMTSQGKSLQMTSQGKHQVYPKGSHKARSDYPREVTKPQIKCIPREAPYKKSLTKAKPGDGARGGEAGERVGDAASSSSSSARSVP